MKSRISSGLLLACVLIGGGGGLVLANTDVRVELKTSWNRPSTFVEVVYVLHSAFIVLALPVFNAFCAYVTEKL